MPVIETIRVCTANTRWVAKVVVVIAVTVVMPGRRLRLVRPNLFEGEKCKGHGRSEKSKKNMVEKALLRGNVSRRKERSSKREISCWSVTAQRWQERSCTTRLLFLLSPSCPSCYSASTAYCALSLPSSILSLYVRGAVLCILCSSRLLI